MIVSLGVLLWAVPFFALLVGYLFGRDQYDPDTVWGWLHYRSKE